ncbi:helix-turn-helix transcriptional regulator [Stenotrophomonas indicatrix]|uniref:helix-turn-helix domain-containing protein n=1 Tax=Stenotrophomonas indicatrix TaxID=2045451 RepID=UPI0015DEE4FD|nr:helix-turn-helix transcriptional regulator [Stenotrophomonas indicatrix]MBA0100780.1 helix-turn-helix transcriptional regulator [Stenotrophomonas indicatrix]
MQEATVQIRVGQAIRARREASGLSQERFADTIEMHRAYYSKVERGERNLTLHTLCKVAAGLGVAPSIILAEAGA